LQGSDLDKSQDAYKGANKFGNAAFWQANEVLISYLSKAIETAAETRYFARLASMWGMDVAHYVAQKTEIGIKPKPPGTRIQTGDIIREKVQRVCADHFKPGGERRRAKQSGRFDDVGEP
jgi:hypothetical protein